MESKSIPGEWFLCVCVVGEGDKAQEFWSPGGTLVINV